MFLLIGILCVLTIIGFGMAYTQPLPNPGHGADTVWISVSGAEMTLQDYITNYVSKQDIQISSGSFNTQCATIYPPAGTSVATHTIYYMAGGNAMWTFEQAHTNFYGGIMASDSGVYVCTTTYDTPPGNVGSYMIIAKRK